MILTDVTTVPHSLSVALTPQCFPGWRVLVMGAVLLGDHRARYSNKQVHPVGLWVNQSLFAVGRREGK